MSRIAILFLLAGLLVAYDGQASGPPAPGRSFGEMRDERPDRHRMLDAVIRDILTNPELAEVRDVYAPPQSRRVVLHSIPSEGLCWPKGYHPEVPGYTFIPSETCQDETRPPMLGMRLDKFRPEEKPSSPFKGQIEVVIHNAGRLDDRPFGGCRISYNLERRGKEWVAVCLMFES